MAKDPDKKPDSYLTFSKSNFLITSYNMEEWSGSRLDYENALTTIGLLNEAGYRYHSVQENIEDGTTTVFFRPPARSAKADWPKIYKSESF